MKVGFYFNAAHLKGFSLPHFEKGKLGISGTDSSFFRVVHGLSKRQDIDVFLFAEKIDHFPGVKLFQVTDITDAILQGKEAGVDLLILNDLKNPDKTKAALHLAESLDFSLVIWAQNPVITLNEYAKSKAVLKIVYVESFDLNQIRHKGAFYKGIVIPNGIEQEVYVRQEPSVPEHFNVLFLGSLTPGKGFHHVARAWPKVLQQVPDACLLVVGSGQLYNNYAKLGPLGIADEQYEAELIPFIGGNAEELQNNHVYFLGLLNRAEIIDTIYNAKVACINPNTWGSLESCSVSSLEIQMCGVPVVAGKAGGNLNTIVHNKTGLLVREQERELPDAIVRLLKDDALNLKMRMAAREHVIKKYELNLIIDKWVDFLQKLTLGHRFPLTKIDSEVAEVKLYMKEAIRIVNKIVGKQIY